MCHTVVHFRLCVNQTCKRLLVMSFNTIPGNNFVYINTTRGWDNDTTIHRIRNVDAELRTESVAFKAATEAAEQARREEQHRVFMERIRQLEEMVTALWNTPPGGGPGYIAMLAAFTRRVKQYQGDQQAVSSDIDTSRRRRRRSRSLSSSW